jgi:flagellar basal body-associated protein FliL
VEPQAEDDSVEPKAEDDSVEPQAEDKPNDKKSVRLQVSISLRSFLKAAVIVALVGAVGVLAWLYVGAQRKLDEQTRRSENNAHAEKVALDYAVNAAAMNFQDLNAWKVKLIAGTSPELKEKLTQAAASMEQILVPLEWSSTARPLAAKVRSVTGGAYVVDSFVGVLTKTVQSPDPLQSTATYSVTIDSAKNWQITDVGGIGSVVEQK